MGKIYLEPVFGLNFVVDVLTLIVAGRLAGERARVWRYIVASVLGGLYAAMMLLPFCQVLNTLPAKAALCLAMAALAWRPRSWRSYLRCVGTLAAVTAVGGGAALAAGVLLDGARPLGGVLALGHNALILCVFGMMAMAVLASGAVRRRGAAQGHYAVRAWCAGKAVRLTALLDTGNLLYEPLSGLPVLIVDASLGRQLLAGGQVIEIPYRTVTGPDTMRAVLAERTMVRDGLHWHDAGTMYLAISASTLSGGAQALLPPAALQ